MPRPRILFLAHLLPWPLTGGGQIKSYHTLRALSERNDVTLFALIRREEEREQVRHLEPFCAGGVECFNLRRSAWSNAVHVIRSLLFGESFIVERDSVSELTLELYCATGGYRMDGLRRDHSDAPAVIHMDHLQMARYVGNNRRKIKVILDQHNVEHRIIQRIAGTPGANLLLRWYAGIEWRKLRDFEVAAMRRADATLAVSDEDRDAFLSLAPDLAGKVETVPIGVDTDYFAVAQRNPDADAILSIGTMSWLPNVDGITWFVSEILPLVREKKQDTRVSIVGANPLKEIIALDKRDPGITVSGTVPDVRPYAKECGVFIVPLRSGSGVRVKILNALSMGLPVVSTTVGAEGIAVTHGENILIADTPRAFADAVCRVLNDRGFADRLGAKGRALVEDKYTWDVVGERLRAVYERVLGAETKS
ncbi:MAG: glycosyltransferase [Akkermansiaceae bacterium]|nr:glycosyltransferase [Armatimonadota bacterium]